MRIAGRGHGKSSGYRVITYFGGDDIPVFLLAVFAKGDKINLSKAERTALKQELVGLAAATASRSQPEPNYYAKEVSMSEAGERLLRSTRNARAFARSETAEGFIAHVPEQIDVKAVRQKVGMTQKEFASHFGFGYDALRDWEAGRHTPERAARVLLTVIGYKPDVVQEALAETNTQ